MGSQVEAGGRNVDSDGICKDLDPSTLLEEFKCVLFSARHDKDFDRGNDWHKRRRFDLRGKDFNTIAEAKKDFNTIATPKKISIPLLTPYTDFLKIKATHRLLQIYI